MGTLITEYIDEVFRALNYNLFALGDAKITPLTIVYMIMLSILLVYLSGKLKSLLINKLLTKTRLDIGAQVAIGTITRYLILFIGFLIVLQSVGINLTTLNVLAGAVGIGIGFGLQNIANNFISGLIILTERPIRIGDRIEVGKVTGEVATIGPRSTRIRTNDNITIIIPNSKFISENVINWSYASNTVRFRIPILVTHDSDVDLVTDLMCEAANENNDVADSPEPTVRLVKIDGDGFLFELRAWSKVRLHRPGMFKSDLNLAIIRKFREHDIRLADSGLLEVDVKHSDIEDENENISPVRRRRYRRRPQVHNESVS